MDNLSGKKLLVLGGTPNEISLVTRAQKWGIYVIVADYHTDRSLSPAKNYADEAWDLSWSDLDTLEQKCREADVSGIMAGYSEIRMEMVIRLCERLGLPCYCNMEQLDITRDKVKFKNACRKNGVPVVREYASVEEVEHYPVIVKPVDRAGSIGISVATNWEQLQEAYRYAMEMSICKKVIIEDYISDATKFDVYYQISDGNVVYACCNDVINAKDNGLERVVQSAWTLPSVHEKAFLDRVDVGMRRMIRDMGIENGYIFFSGFARDNGEFVFFECGFRLCGGHYYDYFYQLGHYNTLDLLIFHAMTGSTKALKTLQQPHPDLKCITLNLYARAGVIASIFGMEEVSQMPDCLMALTQARVGQTCRDDTAILSKIATIHLCNETAEELAEAVAKVYELVRVLDTEGQDMIYDCVDAAAVLHAWNK